MKFPLDSGTKLTIPSRYFTKPTSDRSGAIPSIDLGVHPANHISQCVQANIRLCPDVAVVLVRHADIRQQHRSQAGAARPRHVLELPITDVHTRPGILDAESAQHGAE